MRCQNFGPARTRQVMILHPQTAQTGRNAGSGDIELYGFMAVYRLVWYNVRVIQTRVCSDMS